MPCQPVVLLFALLGTASCALAVARRGRASLLAAGLSAACLAALASQTENLVGMVACCAVLLAALVAVVVAGPWLDAAPLGPLATLASMGLYLRGISTPGSTGELLLLVAAALGALCAADREPDDAQVGATALGLGLLAFGLASETGRVGFWLWGFDAASLALPALAAGVAGAFSSEDEERIDVTVALSVAAVLLAVQGSLAELLVLLLVAASLHVLNAPRRARALLGVVAAAIALGLAALALFPGRVARWLAMPADVYGRGFDLNVFGETLRGAEALGDGVPDALVLLTSDSSALYTLGQAVSAFGWVGLALPVLCVVSVAVAGLRSLPSLDAARRNLVLALLAVFVGSAVGNVLYVFHLAPVPAIQFPLLSPRASAMLPLALAALELSRAMGGAEGAARGRVALDDSAPDL